MEREQSRRDFLQATSAAMAAAALSGQETAAEAEAAGEKAKGEGEKGAEHAHAPKIDPAKILNYNPKMGYRRLGKTGLMISEISLGGHPGPGGNTVEARRAVLERAIELGMNYVDNNIVEECALYGRAMAAGKDLRKHFHIGFASWPEKLTSEYEDQITVPGLLREIDGRLKAYHTEQLDLWRPVGATWDNQPGQKTQLSQNTMWEVNEKTLDKVVTAFEQAHRAGKVRFLGISAHKPSVFRRVLTKYPQFSVILFPYMFLTQAFEGDSLLALAKEKKVGVIGIKPFAAGATFAGGKPTKLEGKIDHRAVSLLKAMLQEKRVSALIPGVAVADQLNENVKASYERDQPLTDKDRQAIRECTESFHAHLPEHYLWLHRWKLV